MNSKKNKYEGKKYIFKKNSIEKAKTKYSPTYYYVLVKILRYKKYINEFKKVINYNEDNPAYLNKLIINIIEKTGNELNIANNKVYSYRKYNRSIKKCLKSILKDEEKNNKRCNTNVIKVYKKIVNNEYKELRNFALKKPKLFLEAIYLYTICED